MALLLCRAKINFSELPGWIKTQSWCGSSGASHAAVWRHRTHPGTVGGCGRT